jgi:hypothetical protein
MRYGPDRTGREPAYESDYAAEAFSLHEFRERYPFAPYRLAVLDGASVVQVISYPWPNGDSAAIHVRLNIGDPTSITTVMVDRLKAPFTCCFNCGMDRIEAEQYSQLRDGQQAVCCELEETNDR